MSAMLAEKQRYVIQESVNEFFESLAAEVKKLKLPVMQRILLKNALKYAHFKLSRASYDEILALEPQIESARAEIASGKIPEIFSGLSQFVDDSELILRVLTMLINAFSEVIIVIKRRVKELD